MEPILENGIIRLRALEPEDIDIMMRWENDSSLWEYGDTLAPYSRLQLAEYLKSYDGDIFTSKQIRLIVEEKDSRNAIGAIDLFDFDFFNSRVGIGILIDKSARGKGLGSLALRTATGYAEDYLGIHQCYATISASNCASIALFKSCGYTHTGTHLQWLRNGSVWTDALLLQHIASANAKKP